MLLLVLILVVLAFGLLVFAPQAGSVLAAWAAVALSAIAGIVLLVDWMQRRSAMRAGAASLEAAGNRPPSRDREWEHDPEPATEVLPVIPPAGPQQGGQVDGPTALTPHLDSGGPERGEDAVDPRFDDAEDNQQTVMMPAVQPPGSSARPSSATPGTTGSSGSSSPSVTETETEVGADAPSEEDAVAAESAADGEAGTTVLVDTRKRPATEAPTAATESGPSGAAEEAAAAGSGSAAPDEARPAEEPSAPAVPAAAAADPRAAGRTGDSNLSGSDLFGAGEQPTQQAAVPETAAQQAQPVQSAPVQAPPVQAPPAQAPPPQWGQPAAAWQPPSGPEQQTQVVQQSTGGQGGPEQGAPEDEPSVEESEPAAAALVATLEDEVVVIDEQPRYHVPGCEALTAHEPIPLPAREAVELGFSPCGWCRPNHTLAERHPAATR